MALWFALDRFEAFKGYKDGEYDFLIINRYVLSNAVYQSIRDRDIGKPDLIDWVFELEYEHLGLPRPALNLFFDVNPESAGRNVDKKGFREYVGGEKRDVYERSMGIQERARDMYLAASERYDDVEIIRCMDGAKMKAPERIGEEVLGVMRSRGLID